MINKKIAIVTGGAAGLGLAITQKLVKENIHTIVIGRNETALKEVAAQLGALCTYKILDLQDTASIPQLIEEIIAEHGAIDILVNNAGINQKKALLEVSDEEFKNIVQTNVFSVFSMSRSVKIY